MQDQDYIINHTGAGSSSSSHDSFTSSSSTSSSSHLFLGCCFERRGGTRTSSEKKMCRLNQQNKKHEHRENFIQQFKTENIYTEKEQNIRFFPKPSGI